MTHDTPPPSTATPPSLQIVPAKTSGLAIAAICIKPPILLISCAIIGLLTPACSRPPPVENYKPMAELTSINTTMGMYMSKNKGQFPPARSWKKELAAFSPYIAQAISSVFDPGDNRVLAMNGKLDQANVIDVRSPEQTVFLFEAAAGSPDAGGPDMFPQTPRPRTDGFLVMFVDRNVRIVRPSDLNQLRWDP